MSIRTVSISNLPRMREEFLSGDDLLPIVDTATGTNRSISVNSIASYTNPIGSVVSFLKTGRVPEYFLPCDGRLVNTGAYIELFYSLSGAQRFGDNFQLPNLTHPDSNLIYYICAGDPRPASFTPVLSSSTNATTLANLSSPVNTVFNIPVSVGGGSANILFPFLSATVVAPSNVFSVNSNLTISLPNSSNSFLFVDSLTPFESVNNLSLTGSVDHGFEKTNTQSVAGMTKFVGINTLSALSILDYNPHLPFVFTNRAVGTVAYNQYLSSKRVARRDNVKIIVQVPAFERVVGGVTYKLKSYIVERKSLSLSQWYNTSGTEVTKTINCDKLVQIFNPAIPTQNIAFNPTLSAALGNTRMRSKLLSDGSDLGYGPTINFIGALSGFGFYQKPWFLANPILINGEWGYPIESTDNVSNNIGLVLTSGLSALTAVPGGAKMLTDTLTGVKSLFYNNTNLFETAMRNVRYRIKNLNSAKTTLLNTTTATDGIKNYLTINLPLDNTINKTIVSYYAR